MLDISRSRRSPLVDTLLVHAAHGLQRAGALYWAAAGLHVILVRVLGSSLFTCKCLPKGLDGENRPRALVVFQVGIIYDADLSDTVDDDLELKLICRHVEQGQRRVRVLFHGPLHGGGHRIVLPPLDGGHLRAYEVHEHVLDAFQAPHADAQTQKTEHDEAAVFQAALAHLVHHARAATDQRQLLGVRSEEDPIPAPALLEVRHGFERVPPSRVPRRCAEARNSSSARLGRCLVRLLASERALGTAVAVRRYALCPSGRPPVTASLVLPRQLVVVVCDRPR
mmetsp:Transcript_105824/g.306121  ORF Transcript_105824/g.306121 Transcript_105824/m.306121 type:complete len:281 (-) Transcript_105824:6-848(-)